MYRAKIVPYKKRIVSNENYTDSYKVFKNCMKTMQDI